MSEQVILGKVAMTLGGDYDSSQSYDKLTCVQYDGCSWVSKKQVPEGVAPTPANSAYWQKISDRGVQGPQGQSYVDKELVPIVNDLTTGGSANVLSAEQGKILDTKLATLSAEIGSFQNHSKEENPLEFTDGYLITKDFLKQATSGWAYSAPTKVTKGAVISVTTSGNNVALIIKADSSGNYLEALAIGTSSVATYTYEAMEDMYVVICYKYSLDVASYSIGGVIDGVEKNKNNIIEINNIINDSVLGKPISEWTNGYLITAELILNDNSAYRYSAPLKVTKGTRITVKTGGSGIGIICQSDAEGKLLKALVSSPQNASPTDIIAYRYEVEEDMYVVICYKYTLENSDYYIGGQGEEIDYINHQIAELKKPRKLRVLVLGNSYAADSWTYVPIILKNYGIDIEIKMYYRGGLALSQLYERWTSKEYQDVEEGYLPGLYTRYLYYCDTEKSLYWQSLERQSAAECVAEGGWDVISMQQMSVASLYEESYEPYAREIIKLIAEGMQTPYTLAFSQIFTRLSHDNIEASMTEQGKFWKKEPFNMLLPYGTSIYNARTNAELAALGNSVSKNLWCSDEVHIQEGLPKYIAALTIVQSLFNRYYNGMSILNDTTRITDALLDSWKMVERRDNAVGITEENCILAQKCAILAVNNPWEILPIL